MVQFHRKYYVFGLATFSGLLIIALGFITLPTVQASDNNFSDGITVDSKLDTADSNVGDNICDDGSGNCTLRAAIEESNATAGTQTIKFNLTGTADFINGGQNGYTIQPTSGLPDITDTVTIDSYSQPGSQPNTAIAPQPLNGRLLIEVDGNLAGSSTGFKFTNNSDNSDIKGLVINRFQGSAISIQNATNTKIQGNYIGTNYTGLATRPNGSDNINSSVAVSIGNTSGGSTSTTDTLIGGLGPADRNVISGNYGGAFGVGAVRTTFYGNFIGLGSDGSTTLANSTGTGVTTGCLTIDYADDVQIGGSQAGAINIISGNTRGIQPDYSNNVKIQGNYIGTDYTGTNARPNLRNGISFGLGTHDSIVGGSTIADGNRHLYLDYK